MKNLYSYLPHNDGIIEFQPPENENIFIKITSAFKLLLKLRKEKFNLVLLGHRKNIFGIILALSGIKYRLGFSRTKFINYSANYDENKHETLKYLDVIKSANLNIKYEYPKLIREGDKISVKKNIGLPQNKKIIGIFPFGGINPGTVMPIKRWEFDKYKVLANKLISEFSDVQLIFLSGSEAGEKIEKGVLNDYVLLKEIDNDIISACDLIIAGDTGTIHIASGFGVSTISLFGPSSPDLLAPRSTPDTRHISIWKKPYCSPCYTPLTSIDKGNKKYWEGNKFICYTGTIECMKNIEVEEVFIKVKEILNFK